MLRRALNDVLDPDDGDAAAMNLPDRVEQDVAFAFGQAAGDLVEQQELRPKRQRLGQLKLLHIQQRELSGRQGSVDEQGRCAAASPQPPLSPAARHITPAPCTAASSTFSNTLI